jgi:hypothetical protein
VNLAVARVLIAVALLLGAYLYGHRVGGTAEKAACQSKQLAAIDDANKRANEADEKLQAELRKPKAGPKIREVVREHPSECVVPKPVGDELRKAVRGANAAAR